MPKVSVIIPSYNCAQYLSEALESVFSQSYKDYEVIVVDDGSTDNIREVVDRFINRYSNQIRYIFQENKGLAVVRNNGIENSLGDYIALLDADDKWFPNRLEEEIKLMESDSQYGVPSEVKRRCKRAKFQNGIPSFVLWFHCLMNLAALSTSRVVRPDDTIRPLMRLLSSQIARPRCSG